MRKLLLHPAAKPVVFVLCLLPLAWLVYATVANQLGANPAEALIRASGDWTLRALCLVLAITPLRVITATPQLARFRRMLGLFVFFYGVLHLLSYSWFDMGFDIPDILHDIAKRRDGKHETQGPQRPVPGGTDQRFGRVGAQLVGHCRIDKPCQRQQTNEKKHRLGATMEQDFSHDRQCRMPRCRRKHGQGTGRREGQ